MHFCSLHDIMFAILRVVEIKRFATIIRFYSKLTATNSVYTGGTNDAESVARKQSAGTTSFARLTSNQSVEGSCLNDGTKSHEMSPLVPVEQRTPLSGTTSQQTRSDSIPKKTTEILKQTSGETVPGAGPAETVEPKPMFYENVAFAGAEIIDLESQRMKEEDQSKILRKDEKTAAKKEVSLLPSGKDDRTSGMKERLQQEKKQQSSSISDEDLIEVAEVERKFVTRGSARKEDSIESDDGGKKEQKRLVHMAVEVEHHDVEWEQIHEQQEKSTRKPVTFQKTVSDSSEEDSSSMSVGRATGLAHEIVGQVIEEAKVRSTDSTPKHQSRVVEPSNAITEDARALAQDIVQNVIDEVRRRLSLHDGRHESELRSPTGKQESGNKESEVTIRCADCTPSSSTEPQPEVQLRTHRSTRDPDRDSGSSSDAMFQSCASDAKSPQYSRPTSGETDPYLMPGNVSSLAAGSSEYETCATSHGSTATFASALASQDTSYTTARSSIGSQMSSSMGSTLEPDSEPESSDHPGGDVSSEASETMIQDDDRDLVTPIDSLTDVQEPYDLPIPEDVIRSGHEGPFLGHLMSGMSQVSGAAFGAEFRDRDDDQPSLSEGTWHSSSVKTEVPGGFQGKRKSESESSSTGNTGQSVVQQTLVSPLSMEGSITSIDLPGGGSTAGSLLSQSSVR